MGLAGRPKQSGADFRHEVCNFKVLFLNVLIIPITYLAN